MVVYRLLPKCMVVAMLPGDPPLAAKRRTSNLLGVRRDNSALTIQGSAGQGLSHVRDRTRRPAATSRIASIISGGLAILVR